MFDARPPKEMTGALPGGNALSFDWHLLDGLALSVPWTLAGGLHAGNVAAAIRMTRAPAVDTSSGVEERPGVKDPAKIRSEEHTSELQSLTRISYAAFCSKKKKTYLYPPQLSLSC